MVKKIKVISLNIEKDKHIPEVLRFLKEENPDVICLQEIFEPNFEEIVKELNFQGVFDPQITLKDSFGMTHKQGVAILSKYPISSSNSIYYTDHTTNNEIIEMSHHSEKDVDKNRTNKKYDKKLLYATIEKDGQNFNFATTHFTWGYYGYVDKNTNEFIWQIDEASTGEQAKDAIRLLKIIASIGHVIFCADTNCPRGQKVFSMFAEKLKDNVPDIYRTSIDGDLHRAGPLPLMVDCLFTTPDYTATNVVLKNGISDHLAVVGEIYKN